MSFPSTGHLRIYCLYNLFVSWSWLFSRQVMCDSLWPHGLQHTRASSPSLSFGVCSSSCPLSWWGHPTISSSVTLFPSFPQLFLASGSFPSGLLELGAQSIGASASISVLPMNIQGVISFRMDYLSVNWTLHWGLYYPFKLLNFYCYLIFQVLLHFLTFSNSC